MAMSRMARSTLAARGLLDGLGAVARLGDHPQVGLAVEDQPEPAAHQGVVVGQQDPGRCAADSVTASTSLGTTQADLGAAAGRGPECAGRRR